MSDISSDAVSTVNAGIVRWRCPNGLILALADVLTATTAIVLATLVVSRFIHMSWTLQAWDPVLALVCATTLVFVNLQLGLYDTIGQGPIERFRLRVQGITLVPWPTLAVLIFLGEPAFPAAVILAAMWGLLIPLALLAESMVREALVQRGSWGESAVLVGSDAATARLGAHLLDHPELGLRPIGRVDNGSPDDSGAFARVPRIGTISDVMRHAGIADVAVVSLSSDMPGCELLGLPFGRVIVMPEATGMPALWLSTCGLGEAPCFAFANRTGNTIDHRLKRLFDLAVAAPLLLLALPVIGVSALLIKAVSSGPAFYSQQRVGFKGEPVEIVKLRTMHVDAERRLQDLLARNEAAREEWDRYMKLSRDPRVLPMLGNFLRRTSLDELPQLWNVVRGDISLVGPRPFPGYHVDCFDIEFQRLRVRVKPGLTGLWQVTERSNADLRRQEEIDTFYIRNWSLWLDLYIVAKTLPAMLSTRGAR